jgi:hypothetical protein
MTSVSYRPEVNVYKAQPRRLITCTVSRNLYIRKVLIQKGFQNACILYTRK